MAKIAFFCIPAYGHTNPTLEVVRHLVERGNTVHYYSYFHRHQNSKVLLIECWK